MRRGTAITTLIAALALSATLVSCTLLKTPAPDTPVTDEPTAGAPEGWQNLTSCEGGPQDDFVWVDGLPSAELGAAGVNADCGDVYFESDGDNFVGVADYSMTEEELDAIGTALIAAGWENKWDDFEPVSSPDADRDYRGARDFYTDDDERLLAVEIYHNGTDPVSYTAYIDYHSPETRELEPR